MCDNNQEKLKHLH